MDADLRRVFLLVLLSPSLHLVSSDLRENRYVYISNLDYTWEKADQHCKTFHDGLITIRNKEQDDLLTKDGWIGLRLIGSNWMWPGGELLNYSHWENGEPQSPRKCAQKTSNGWKAKSCDDNAKFYCTDEKLVLIREEKTWEEALQYCRGLGSLGYYMSYDLATLETPDDQLFAYEKAQNATTIEVWTGLRYLGGSWFWVRDGGQTFPTTLPVCPDHHNFCGTVSQTSQGLQTRNCMERINFFCQRW
ncbi:unnamed protein product [Lota lota]